MERPVCHSQGVCSDSELQAIVKESFSNTFSKDSFFSTGDGLIPSEPSKWFPTHPDKIFLN